MLEFLVEGFIDGAIEIVLEFIFTGELGLSANRSSREVVAKSGELSGTSMKWLPDPRLAVCVNSSGWFCRCRPCGFSGLGGLRAL